MSKIAHKSRYQKDRDFQDRYNYLKKRIENYKPYTGFKLPKPMYRDEEPID
jgi:hypothetical protein